MDIIYEIKKDNINYSIINKKYNIKKKFRINRCFCLFWSLMNHVSTSLHLVIFLALRV